MLAYIVAGLTVTLLAAAAAEFWKRCFRNPEPPGGRTARDETSPGQPTDAGAPHDGAPQGEPSDDRTTHDAATPDRPAPPRGLRDAAPPDQDETAALPATPGPRDLDPRHREQPASETAPVPATLGVRWSWRRHRSSGLQFLRVTIANAGPTAATVTRVRLRMSAELADHAEPPADLLEASDQAAALFGSDAGDALLPLTLEPGGGADAYFPCRDVADWLYGVAEGGNLDRNECRLVPECMDDAGSTHSARRKVDYETWLMHGHGPSLRQYAEEESADALD